MQAATNSCCKRVAQLIYEFTRDEAMWGQFVNVPDLQPEPRWTEQEANIMANKQERLFYQTSKATGTRDDLMRQLTETNSRYLGAWHQILLHLAALKSVGLLVQQDAPNNCPFRHRQILLHLAHYHR